MSLKCWSDLQRFTVYWLWSASHFSHDFGILKFNNWLRINSIHTISLYDSEGKFCKHSSNKEDIKLSLTWHFLITELLNTLYKCSFIVEISFFKAEVLQKVQWYFLLIFLRHKKGKKTTKSCSKVSLSPCFREKLSLIKD